MKHKTSKDEMEEKNNHSNKKRPKRISKSEEEKRAQILNPILGKWAYVKNHYEKDDYYFVKHVLINEGKYSRLKQVLLSKYPEQDGIYEISDYEIGFIFDAKTLKKKVEIKTKKYDMTYGLYSENEFAESYDELISNLINLGYTSAEEVSLIQKDKLFHKTCDEVVLSFVRNHRKKTTN